MENFIFRVINSHLTELEIIFSEKKNSLETIHYVQK